MNRKLDRVTSKLREIWLSLPASSEFEDLRLRFLNNELQVYLSSVQDVRREFLTFVLSCSQDLWTLDQMETAIIATGSLQPLDA